MAALRLGITPSPLIARCRSVGGGSGVQPAVTANAMALSGRKTAAVVPERQSTQVLSATALRESAAILDKKIVKIRRVYRVAVLVLALVLIYAIWWLAVLPFTMLKHTTVSYTHLTLPTILLV